MANPNRTSASSRLRSILCLFFAVAAGIAMVAAIDSPRAGRPPEGGTPNPSVRKIAPWVIGHTVNGRQEEFFVVLADQAGLSGAATLATKADKGRYVYNTLLNKAHTTQGPILQWLRERGIGYRPFYIVNAILVKGSREIAEALAARPDVARLEGNPVI